MIPYTYMNDQYTKYHIKENLNLAHSGKSAILIYIYFFTESKKFHNFFYKFIIGQYGVKKYSQSNRNFNKSCERSQ